MKFDNKIFIILEHGCFKKILCSLAPALIYVIKYPLISILWISSVIYCFNKLEVSSIHEVSANQIKNLLRQDRLRYIKKTI